MRVPLEWLREYVDVGLKSETLAEKLTMAGSEVSAIEFHGKGVEGIVVGKIKAIDSHPRADDLRVIQVDIGTKILQLVTNVKTLKAGYKVPVAVHGARLAGSIHVEKRELHGVESFGMLCSLEHLGLAEASEEVMILDKDAPLGANIKNVLGVKGTILEVEVLPNRGDLLSMIGVAREISAVLNKPLKLPRMTLKEKEKDKGKVRIEVRDDKLCPRYMARVIEGVKIKESPQWMKERLIACGLRPINNVVDITNYVLLEMGQPLHAFDLDKLEGGRIIVRKAGKGEEIVTIDGEKRKLFGDSLVIADSSRPVAVAGVMGGRETEVTDSTVNLLLESACFDPASVSRTSRKLKLRSDSSARFERGVDWNGVGSALDRAAELILELACGEVAGALIDVKSRDRKPAVITLRPDFINAVLGTKIPLAAVKSILKRLGFTVQGSKNLKVTVPTFRAGDIEREIDLVEEVARLHGYDNIDSSMPSVTYVPSDDDDTDRALDFVRYSVKDAGFFESQTFSIVNPKDFSGLPLDGGDPRMDPVKVENPLSEEASRMRTLLFPSLLNVISRNVSRQNRDIAVFEIGKTFIKKANRLPEERMFLSLASSGKVMRGSFKISGAEDMNFYHIKSVIEGLCDELGAKGLSFEPKKDPLLARGRAAAVKLAGKEIGFIGRVSSSVAACFDMKTQVDVAEVDIMALLKASKAERRFVKLARHPKVSRDIAMFVPDSVSHADIVSVIEEKGAPLLESVELFDRYKGKQVPAGFVSLAYRLDYRERERTLTDEEVNDRHSHVIEALKERLKVAIRQE